MSVTTIACSRCGVVPAPPSYINGWWLRQSDQLCATCVRIVTSDDTDHGDEHVESLDDSESLHARGETHPTRSCRVCIYAGAPLRPDVRWCAQPQREKS